MAHPKTLRDGVAPVLWNASNVPAIMRKKSPVLQNVPSGRLLNK
jgi:hypothetical protein